METSRGQIETMLLESEAMLKQKAESKYTNYFKMAWNIIEPKTRLMHNWHHELIAEYLTACYLRQIKRLIINIEPRSLKSNLVSVCFPTWVWFKNPAERFVCTSYSAGLANKHSEDRRAIIGSPWYQARWGDRFSIVKDTTASLSNDRRGVIETTSLMGSATGKGGNFLIVDDPHDISRAGSDVIREREVETFERKFTTRLDDKVNGVIIIIMQRLHEKDLSGHLLTKPDGDKYYHLKIPAEALETTKYFYPISRKVKLYRQGEVMQPARESKGALAKQRGNLGSFGYAGQYMQDPSPREGGIFKKKYWKYYSVIPMTKEGLYDFDEIVDVWDCSFKDKESSSFVAGGTWGIKGPFRYLLNITYERLGFLATIKAMLRHRNMFLRPGSERVSYIEKTIIEDKANGTAIIEVLKQEIQGIIAFEPHGDKAERAAAIEPQLESGCFLLPTKAIATFDVEMYIDNLAKFPNAEHKDLVDMTTMTGIYLKQSTMDVDFA